jgi:hypothetical protein
MRGCDENVFWCRPRDRDPPSAAGSLDSLAVGSGGRQRFYPPAISFWGDTSVYLMGR